MSENRSDEEKTLTRNQIKTFILKIDLIESEKLKIGKIAEAMSKYFDRTEKRQISNFAINLTKNSTDMIKKEELFDFVLISEKSAMSMTFSEVQNSFWLESTQYRNNSLYKDLIKRITDIFTEISNETESKRIGLRYINEYTCEKNKDISRIYNKRLSSALKFMISEKNQSRVIGMEEYNNDDGYKLRLHYGIPNKFYPSIITTFDLLLDIDSFIERTCSIHEWGEVITNLNRAAYSKFINEINPKYLEELK